MVGQKVVHSVLFVELGFGLHGLVWGSDSCRKISIPEPGDVGLLCLLPDVSCEKRTWPKLWENLMIDAGILRQHLIQMLSIEGRVIASMDQVESTTPHFLTTGITHDATSQDTSYCISVEFFSVLCQITLNFQERWCAFFAGRRNFSSDLERSWPKMSPILFF